MDRQEDEFLRIYEDFSDAIFRHCYFRVSDRELAKDLTQETFIKVWEYMVNGKIIEKLKPFLYRVAINLIIDNARRKARKGKEFSLEDLKERGQIFNDPAYEEKFPSQIETRDMLKILDNLESESKDILIMRYIDELSPKEISEILEQSENAISVRIHRILKKLRRIIGENE